MVIEKNINDITTGYIETYIGNNSNTYFEFSFEFIYNNTIYILEPDEDITAYELWNIYKLIEEIKLNHYCNDIIYRKIYELKIERHFKWKNTIK